MQLLVFIILYPILWVISILPFRIFYWVSDAIYFLVYKIIGYRKKVVRKNLELSFPEKSKAELDLIESRFYQHMVDLFLEMIKSMNISKEEMIKRFQYSNLELLSEYEEKGKSIVMVIGHYGSYEWFMSLGYFIKHEGHAIYAPLSNKYLDRLVKKIRSKHNAYMVSRYHVLDLVKKHKEDGTPAIYGFANDQSPQAHKARYWRPFMGVTVPVFTYAESLAKEMDLPVMYCGINKEKRGYYKATFKVITDTPRQFDDYEITDRFTELLEEQIKADPAYYLWSHNRFKHKDKVPAVLKR
ncbi:lipid A biosynthesis acyltransferase [Robertkochia marina]|uniref:Lipid A biosynthesis acyltransferase n=1 Tax=Robertkochia marina TaxID=1227945 RepID=A0A4S3M0F8_9FLAO|nr:lysophospholipid acyltransferase family protein [Robertkochia marina]THD67874.1 lipid A biosynthesis acyltransferase [Robertkochia marina]TRZ42087.1 lipid A biosynthesis acyltransferase [Robertkochia marina]